MPSRPRTLDPTHNPQREGLLAKQHEPDAPDDRKRHKYDPEADGRGSLAGTLDRIVKVLGFHCQMPRCAIFRAATKPAASSGMRAAATLNFGDCDARRSFFRIRRGTPIFASDLSTFGISISASLQLSGHRNGRPPRATIYVDPAFTPGHHRADLRPAWPARDGRRIDEGWRASDG